MEQTPVAEPEQNDTVKAIGALGERGDANFQAPVVKTIKPETVKPPPPVQKPVSMTTMMKRAVMRSVSAAPDTATGARDTGPGLSLPSQALNGLGDNYGVKDQGVVTVYGGSAFRSVYNGKLTAKVYYIPPSTRRIRNLQNLGEEKVRMYADAIDTKPQRFTSGFGGVDNRRQWLAIQYQGSFTVNEAGTYKFRIYSDDGSIVWIDGKEILDNDGLKDSGATDRVGSIELQPGDHRLRILYFQGESANVALSFYVTPPHSSEILFNARRPLGEAKETPTVPKPSETGSPTPSPSPSAESEKSTLPGSSSK
jgi:hypothetical protein